MASPMSASTLLRVLRGAGLDVREYKNWRNHNRNHKGAWGPINGVMMHHTVTSANSDSVGLCYNGHSTLPGPLCHGVITKSGTIYLVSAGRANHAGSGDDDVMRQVVAESYGSSPSKPNEANTDGNSRFYGFECVNLGNGRDPWPAAQVDAMVSAAAAICKHYGWSAKSVIAHKEWQPGKIDPRGPGFPSMQEFRTRVQREIDGKAPSKPSKPKPAPKPKEPDTMKMNDQVNLGDWIPKRFPNQKGLQDGKIAVSTALGSGYAYAHIAADNTDELVKDVAALRSEVKALSQRLDGMDLDALTDAIEGLKITLNVE